MARGKRSEPTPLPEAFRSWRELYDAWEQFRTTEPRTVQPSRAVRFAQMHGFPEWILGTVPYIFRTAERDDEVGEFARKLLVRIEQNKIGIPKANNEIRAFTQQSPRFRDPKVQRTAMADLLRQLRAMGILANAIRNFSSEITTEELKQFASSILLQTRELTSLRNRIAKTIEEREEES